MDLIINQNLRSLNSYARGLIEPRNSKDAIFRVLIGLELADKEQLSELAEIIKNNSRQN